MVRTLSIVLVAVLASSSSAQPTPAAPATKPVPAARPAPASAPVRKVRGAGDAPAIAMADAINMARTYARKNHIDLSKQYLQSASFDVVQRDWGIAWQLAFAKGGHTELIVHEDGTIKAVFGE